jgi:hypothetical protein
MRCLVFALLSVAIGVGNGGAQTRDSHSRVQSMTGVVKTASDSSLTIVRGRDEFTFDVDLSTRVVARGGPSRNPERRLTFPDVVKPGARVAVRYRQLGSAMSAVEVRVVYR